MGSRIIRTSERRPLKFILPFRVDRILKVLRTTKEVAGKQRSILEVLKDNYKWYARMAETYFRYCIGWGLIVQNEQCKNTPLGEAVLALHDIKPGVATELVYYAFASSEQYMLSILVRNLFENLEKFGPFEVINTDVTTRFLPELEGRSGASDLMKVFNEVKFLKGLKSKGKLVYHIDHCTPLLGSFAISLLHHIQVKGLTPPHVITLFDQFRALWFMGKNDFVKYLRRCRATDIVSYQEYADINQFEFLVHSIPRLVSIIKQSEAL